MSFFKALSLVTLLVCGYIQAVGDNLHSDYTIRFRLNESVVDTSYCGNAKAISSIVNLIDSINRNSRLRLRQVTVTGSTSPEGPTSFNKQLAGKRISSAMNIVHAKASVPDSLITIRSIITDWESLKSMIAASDMPEKEEAIKAIENEPECITDSEGNESMPRKVRLAELRNGLTWQYMLNEFYPALRKTSVEITAFSIPEVTSAIAITGECDTVATSDTVTTVTSPEPVMQEAQCQETKRKPLYMSLSTNMLYDALLVPNIGAEFYLGRNWSIAADWMYGWWDTDKRHRYWRLYGGEIAVRRWFGAAAARKPLTGHHAGLYAQAITYDFEFGGKGQMAGNPGGSLWDKCSFGFGLEYGYSMPLTPRLNIDFTIGVGYFGGTYYEYRPIDGLYVWESTHRRNWFGPTRAMVSLVWLLGHGNRNAKGGKK